MVTLHTMKELEDYDWFPPMLRQMQLEFIGYTVYATALLKPLVPLMDERIATPKYVQLVDLCSGSGMPMLYLAKQIKHNLPITLTDKFPQPNATNAVLRYQQKAVDVLKMQWNTNTIYTMFNAFHHFNNIEQKQIIQNAAEQKATVLIVEILTPSVWTMVQVLFTATVLQLIFTPFVPPFRWQRLLFTYLIPINIVTVLWDGIISVLKSKSKKGFIDLANATSTNDYNVQVQFLKSKGNTLILLQGKPND